MGYVRFRRFRQWGRYNTKFFLKLDMWRKQQQYPDQVLPAVIQNQGIRVEDPNHPDFPRKRTLDPIPLNHPAWPKSAPPEQHPWYRSEAGYLYTGADPLAAGINHALTISKAVHRQGLPESILRTSNWFDALSSTDRVQQLIMHSQRWDATIEELPKRRDPICWWHIWPTYHGIPQARKNGLLLDNLHRFSHVEGVRQGNAEFKARKYVRLSPINVVFERLGQSICLNFAPHITMSQPEPIPALMDIENVDETANEPLMDISPVVATVDLKKTNIFNPDNVVPFSWSASKQFIHTIFVQKVNDVFYPWSPNELVGHAVMSAFTAALASAKMIYPAINGALPKPVTVQCVQCCGTTFDFVVFQLNTMDFSKDTGIKNIAYIDAGNKLFSPIEHWKPYENVIDYNPDVLRKYMALLSNGVNVTQKLK